LAFAVATLVPMLLSGPNLTLVVANNVALGTRSGLATATDFAL
jgi:hypothetical protein